ncbi:MAG: MFS transporter [Phycisphaerales bacterium]|nr:MFS transporter [Phycisphaerales bacterium]
MNRPHLPHGAPRRAFGRELAAWSMLPVMVGAVEGGVMGTIASRFYEHIVPEQWLDFAVAFMVGAKAFANLASIFWAAAASGRRKIRFITTLMLCSAACVLGVAFMPRTPVGLLGMVFLMTSSSVCWSGVVTLRTTVWAANYPRVVRASIAGKLAIVQALVLASVGLLIGWAQDVDPTSFRWLYPLAVGISFIGIAVYAGLPLRGHRRLLRSEQHSGGGGYFASLRFAAKPLRRDRRFRQFMGCLFLLGFGNMMVAAPLVLALRSSFDVDNLVGIAAVSSVPIFMMPLAIPLWSRLLNKMHVIRFRAVHSWVFVLSNAMLAAAVLSGSMGLLWISAIVRGTGFAGGVLAWNLGHHDFAPVENSGAYMGTHVTLTGIRGLAAPMVGVLGWHLVGGWVFLAPIVLAMAGGLGFAILAKRHASDHD